jgi:hypothetical protein
MGRVLWSEYPMYVSSVVKDVTVYMPGVAKWQVKVTTRREQNKHVKKLQYDFKIIYLVSFDHELYGFMSSSILHGHSLLQELQLKAL